MRYCVTGETRVATADGARARIDAISSRARSPNSDTDVDLKVKDRLGDRSSATKLFHSGEHPTLRLRTREGYELTGTHNHPVLCLVDMGGVPTAAVEAARGDRGRRPRAARRGLPRRVEHGRLLERSHDGAPRRRLRQRGLGLGERGPASTTSTASSSTRSLDAYDVVVGGPRYVYRADDRVRQHAPRARRPGPRPRCGAAPLGRARRVCAARDKKVPEFVWRGGAAREGRVPAGALRRRRLVVAAAAQQRSRSRTRRTATQLARDVQQLLLEFGVVSQALPVRQGRDQGRHHQPARRPALRARRRLPRRASRRSSSRAWRGSRGELAR